MGTELGHSFLSPEPRKRNEVMILYYDMKGHVRRVVVKWLPFISNGGRAEPLRVKSIRFGEGFPFDIVSALSP